MKYFGIILVVLYLCGCHDTHQQLATDESNLSSLESYVKAREIVEKWGQAGGYTSGDASTGLQFYYQGEVYALFQGNGKDSLHKELRRDGLVIIEAGSSGYYYESTTYWPYFESLSKSLMLNDTLYTFRAFSNTYSVSTPDKHENPWNIRIPELLYAKIVANRSSLRYEGEMAENGTPYHRVSVVIEDELYTLFIKTDNYQLFKLSFLEYFPDLGDAEVELCFRDYWAVDGKLFPRNIQRSEKGFLVFNYQLDDSSELVIEKSKILTGYDLVENNAEPVPPKTELIELADNIHLIKQIGGSDYHAAFLNFGNYLVALEAPLGDWASKMAIDEIRKLYPQKPIKYVMITHFHGDHSGGLREYVRQGAAIIAPRNSQQYFDILFSATHSLQNDSAKQLSPEILVVEEEPMTLTSDSLNLIIQDIGPNAHVNNILVAYIPEAKFLFQGDLFRVPQSSDEPVRKEAVEFYEKIKSQGWEVDMLTGAHGEVGSLDDLKSAIERVI